MKSFVKKYVNANVFFGWMSHTKLYSKKCTKHFDWKSSSYSIPFGGNGSASEEKKKQTRINKNALALLW